MKIDGKFINLPHQAVALIWIFTSVVYNNKQKAMGFKYRIEVKESIYEGLGIFAAEFIPKGEVISTFIREKDDIIIQGHSEETFINYDKQYLKQLQRTDKDKLAHILRYGFYHAGSDSFIVDHSPRRFSNHSNDPNYEHVVDKEARKQHYRAVRDIYPGEELLQKYWGIKEYSQVQWLFPLFCQYEHSRVKTMALVCD